MLKKELQKKIDDLESEKKALIEEKSELSRRLTSAHNNLVHARQNQRQFISSHNANNKEALRELELTNLGHAKLLETIESWHCNHSKRRIIERFIAHSIEKSFEDFNTKFHDKLFITENDFNDLPF